LRRSGAETFSARRACTAISRYSASTRSVITRSSSRCCAAVAGSESQIVASPPASTTSSASHSSCSRFSAPAGSATTPSTIWATPSRRSLRQSVIRGVEGVRGSR